MHIALLLGVVLGLVFASRPRAVLFGAIAAAGILGSSTAHAYGAPPPDGLDNGLVISATGVTMIIAIFIPVLTGLVTKATTSSWAKGLITLVSNAIAALLTTSIIADGSAVLSWQTVVTWLVGFVTSIGMYTGLWKPAAVTSSVIEVNGREVAGKLSNVGRS